MQTRDRCEFYVPSDALFIFETIQITQGRSAERRRIRRETRITFLSECLVFLVELQAGELDEVMYLALLGDRVDFIKLLLENGVSLKQFLTVKRMIQLYNNVR